MHLEMPLQKFSPNILNPFECALRPGKLGRQVTKVVVGLH
jgi:hypothetical protein